MAAGGKKVGPKSDINVTPLVDVVLVLLVIFMVITPLALMGYKLQVPEKVENVKPNPEDLANQLVVSVGPDPDRKLFINNVGFDDEDSFGTELTKILRERQAKMVFFSCNRTVKYGESMKKMDIIRRSIKDSGAKTSIGIVLEPTNPMGS